MNKIFSKYIPIFFILLSVLFLLFIIYKAEYFHEGTKINYYKIYYIIGIVFLFFSIINFFLNKELKIKTSIIVLSTIFSLYLFEGFLSISGLSKEKFISRVDDPSIQAKLKKNPNFDTRSLIEVYNDMKIKDKNTVLAIYPGTSFTINPGEQFLQLSGISNKKTILCNENGDYATYQSDRYGFNNPDKEWDKKQVEFFLVGDSYVHGACVNEKDTISSNIRKKIKSGSVLNLGYGNNGPLLEYATLREYLPLTNTKKVIWVYFAGNDLMNLNSEINNIILLNYLNNKEFSQNLSLKQKDIDTKLKKFLQKGRYSEQQRHKTNKLSRFIKLSFIRIYTTEKVYQSSISSSISRDETLDKFTEIISLSKSFTQKQGAKFYFVYLPDNKRHFIDTIDYNKNYKEIINIVKNLEIPIIDIYKELHLTLEDPISLYPLRERGHYNELGYRLISEIILKKIDEYN